MKSRLVILSMLVFGMLLSTAGAGLAVSGLSGQKDASIAQYAGNETPSGGGDVLGDEDSGTNVPANNGPGDTNPGGGEDDTQPARQVEAGANTDVEPAVHRLRRDPGAARRHRAPERGPRAAAPHRRRALSTRSQAFASERGGLRPASLALTAHSRGMAALAATLRRRAGLRERSPRSSLRASGSSGLSRRASLAAAVGSSPASAWVAASP